MSAVVHERSRAALALEAARAAYGIRLLLNPSAVGQDTASRVLARVLGVRQLAQAGLAAWQGGRTTHSLGAVVDALHALSMLPVASRPRWRGFARSSAAAAVVLGVVEGVVAARERRP